MFQTRTDIEGQGSQQKEASLYMRHGKQVLKVILALFLFAALYGVLHLILGSFKPRGESNIKGGKLLKDKDKISDEVDNEQAREPITTKAHQRTTRDIATVDGYISGNSALVDINSTNVVMVAGNHAVSDTKVLVCYPNDMLEKVRMRIVDTKEGDLIVSDEKLVFNANSFNCIRIKNGEYRISYWSPPFFDRFHIKSLSANGTEIKDFQPLGSTTDFATELIPHSNGHYILQYLIDYFGPEPYIARQEFDENDNPVGGNEIIVSGTDYIYQFITAEEEGIEITIYNRIDMDNLRGKFRLGNGTYSEEFTLIVPGKYPNLPEIDSIDNLSVAFGTGNKLVVAYKVNAPGTDKDGVYVQGGNGNGNFSEPVLIPSMRNVPDVTYIGDDQFDIASGGDGVSGVPNVICMYNGYDSPTIEPQENIGGVAWGPSTVVTSEGIVVRGILSAGEIWLFSQHCTPHPCLHTLAEYNLSDSSLIIQDSSVPSEGSSYNPSTSLLRSQSPSSSSSFWGSSGEASNALVSSDSISISQLPFSLASSSERKGNGAVIASVVVIGSTIVAAGIVASGVFYWRRCRNRGQEFDGIALKGKMPVEFGSVIGQGGFGTVLRGIWIAGSKKDGPQKGETVAIKELPEKLTELPEMLAEFKNEAELMQRCDHPNIIKCYDFFISPRCCIVMPLFPKGSLDNILGSLRWYPQGLPIVKGIIKGLRYLHEQQNVIHRDLKPGNILIKEENGELVPVITDLGSAKAKQHTFQDMTKGVGTPAYIAPEILAGETNYTKKVDVHSFGLIVWAIYTGKEPFQGYAFFQLSEHILQGGRPEIPKQCPYSLAKLMSDCWMPRPDNRPTMQEVSVKIQQIEGEGKGLQLSVGYS